MQMFDVYGSAGAESNGEGSPTNQPITGAVLAPSKSKWVFISSSPTWKVRDLQFRSFWRCSDRHVSADVCLKLGRQDVRRRGRGRGQNLPQDCRLDFQQSTCILLAFSTYFQESTCVTFCTHQVRGLPATATACLPGDGAKTCHLPGHKTAN